MKGFLFACVCGMYTAVSWLAAGTLTGIDPTTAMKLLLHGSRQLPRLHRAHSPTRRSRYSSSRSSFAW